jgi:hypothetical protein
MALSDRGGLNSGASMPSGLNAKVPSAGAPIMRAVLRDSG